MADSATQPLDRPHRESAPLGATAWSLILLGLLGAGCSASSDSTISPTAGEPERPNAGTIAESSLPPTTASSQIPNRGLSFSNQTANAGVGALHGSPIFAQDPKEDGSRMMAGMAAGDFNNDGWSDLFVIGGGLEPDSLFINRGDNTFDNLAEQAGLADLHVGAGAAVADYNGDGFLDIFVTSFGDPESRQPGQHRLYNNNGDLTFTDVAVAAGVNNTSAEMADGFGSTFGDIDLDGDLDLFVAGWRKDSFGNRLFRNDGDGTFTDVTDAAGIEDTGIRGFAPCLADMDGDRYPELLLVADFGTSRYFVNDRDGTFQEAAASSLTGREWSGMGSAVGDFNNDGFLDWYVTAISDDDAVGRGDGNKLYLNMGEHQYNETAVDAGVADGHWGWGTVAVDLNHDGWLDIVETNGWSDLEAYRNDPSLVWLSNADGTFTDVALSSGFDHDLDGLGLLNMDYDNDGDQDVVVTSLNERLRLYRNDIGGAETNWLRVFLDTSANPTLAPNGIGSRIRVMASGSTMFRYIDGCSHYLSQSEMSGHFGLGAVEVIDEVRVEWTDGTTTILTGVPANQTLTVAAPAT